MGMTGDAELGNRVLPVLVLLAALAVVAGLASVRVDATDAVADAAACAEAVQ